MSPKPKSSAGDTVDDPDEAEELPPGVAFALALLDKDDLSDAEFDELIETIRLELDDPELEAADGAKPKP